MIGLAHVYSDWFQFLYKVFQKDSKISTLDRKSS